MSNHKTDLICDRALCAIAGGDRNALSDIYDCMGKQIYFLAYSILKDHHDAEDVLGEVLCELAENAAAYKKGSHARAYILSVARNQALKMHRDKKNHLPLDEISEDARYARSDDEFISRLTMFDALKTLSEKESEIVLLHIESGMKFREIGEMLGLKTATAQKKYRRALAKLREYYESK